MRKITVNFEGEVFVLKETELGFNLNDLRLKLVEKCEDSQTPYLVFEDFMNMNEMARWTRILSNTAKDFYELTTVRGGTSRGTYSNEQGVFAYSEWLNEKFGFAVINAFTAAVRGDGDEAVRIAQEVAEIRDMWRVDHPEV